MDGRIMCCGIISSCQSVKRCWACVHYGAVPYQVPDLYMCYIMYHCSSAKSCAKIHSATQTHCVPHTRLVNKHKTTSRIIFTDETQWWMQWETRPELTWCARQMRSKSCLCRNLATTSAPNVNETPRSFSPQPIVSLSGSDHSKSHSRPWSGTSVGRIIRRICSIDCRSGLKPTYTCAHIHRLSGCRTLLLSTTALSMFVITGTVNCTSL